MVDGHRFYTLLLLAGWSFSECQCCSLYRWKCSSKDSHITSWSIWSFYTYRYIAQFIFLADHHTCSSWTISRIGTFPFSSSLIMITCRSLNFTFPTQFIGLARRLDRNFKSEYRYPAEREENWIHDFQNHPVTISWGEFRKRSELKLLFIWLISIFLFERVSENGCWTHYTPLVARPDSARNRGLHASRLASSVKLSNPTNLKLLSLVCRCWFSKQTCCVVSSEMQWK